MDLSALALMMLLARPAQADQAPPPEPKVKQAQAEQAPPEITEEQAEKMASTYYITADTSEAGPARPGKRFDPDTELRLDSKQLRERGVTNLAEALELVSDASLRPSGRGEVRVDLRGARKGSVLVLIDGVPINEPFYGTFDMSSIPITDIAEIRMSMAPASPLDGPGGSGGVIEVVTTAATGPHRVQARVEGSSAPGMLAQATGRGEAARGLSIRVSGGGGSEGRDFDVLLGNGSLHKLPQDANSGQAALRLEYGGSHGLLVGDAWFEHRNFVVPPTDDTGAIVEVIDGETAINTALGGQTGIGHWRLEGRGYAQKLDRTLLNYTDATLSTLGSRESISADREGLLLRANRLLGSTAQLALHADFDTEHAVDEAGGARSAGRTAISELAAGLLWTPRPTVRLDVSSGFFVPIDDPASPWPEGKLGLTLLPRPWLELRATGARKGRTPTIRERYGIMIGDPNIRPEMSTYGEFQVAVRPRPWIVARSAVYVRQTDDLIRFNDAHTMQVNYGDVQVRGVDSSIELNKLGQLGGGASYQFADSDDTTGLALENFPRHKADAWIEGRLRQRVGLWLRGRYVGDRIDKSTHLGDYATLDASAWVNWREYRLAARVENATDERYQIAAGLYAFGRTVFVSLDGLWE